MGRAIGPKTLRPKTTLLITRPGGVKEPGVTNIKGECCSSFYSNSGNAGDCVPQRRLEH